MFRIRSGRLILFMVGLGILAWVLPVAGEEKVINFSKDIGVVPINSDNKTKVKIDLRVNKTRLKPGDTVKVSFETDRDAYLTLVDVGTSGRITRLWPNQFSGSDNLVRAGKRYAFPSSTDRFQFTVSGPEGLERIVAFATSEKNRILKEEEFSEYHNGFKSYSKNLKDLVVEAVRRTDRLSDGVNWGTAEVRMVIGPGPVGGRITSRNVYVVGVGSATGSLQYCEDDAKRFVGLMEDKLKLPRENVRMLLGSHSTKEDFLGALRWLAQRTQPEDLVIIYFSGHGTLVPDPPGIRHEDGKSAAFVCYHTKQNLRIDDPDLDRILLLGAHFAKAMRDVPARRRLIVVDSCHSGSINKSLTPDLVSKFMPVLSADGSKELGMKTEDRRSDAGFEASRYKELIDNRDTLVAACAKPESSYEDRGKRSGLFTYWFIKCLEQAGGNLREAFNKSKDKVVAETSGAGLRQTPQLTDENGLTGDVKF